MCAPLLWPTRLAAWGRGGRGRFGVSASVSGGGGVAAMVFIQKQAEPRCIKNPPPPAPPHCWKLASNVAI